MGVLSAVGSVAKLQLAGLAPETLQIIRNECRRVIRSFDGAPEHVAEFNLAQDLWRAIDEIGSP